MITDQWPPISKALLGKIDWSEETGDLLETAAIIHQVKIWSVLECPWLLEMWAVIEEYMNYMNIVLLLQQCKSKDEVKNLPVDGIKKYIDVWGH